MRPACPFHRKYHTSCILGKDGGKCCGFGFVCRAVVIERDGINSVMVNESPQNWHERMLVAATVSLSASGVHTIT